MKKLDDLFPLELPTYPHIPLSIQERCRDIAIEIKEPTVRKSLLFSVMKQDFVQIAYYKKFSKQLSQENEVRRIQTVTIITNTWDIEEIEAVHETYKFGKILYWNPFKMTKKWFQWPQTDDNVTPLFRDLAHATTLVISLKGEPSSEGKVHLNDWMNCFTQKTGANPANFVHSLIIEDLNILFSLVREDYLANLFSNENCAVTCCYDKSNLSELQFKYIEHFFMQKFIFENVPEQPKVGKALLNNFMKNRSITFNYQPSFYRKEP